MTDAEILIEAGYWPDNYEFEGSFADEAEWLECRLYFGSYIAIDDDTDDEPIVHIYSGPRPWWCEIAPTPAVP